MIIDRDIMQEYPFDGVFYTYGIDGSKPADQQKEDSGVISNAYNVYFPFDKSVGISIKKGHKFRSKMYGFSITDAIVIDIIPTQLGGCAVYVKDNTSG